MIRDIEEGDGPDYQYISGLEVDKSDIEITKVFNNSFWQTNLDQILKEKRIDTVIISGNALEHCVTATYFGAKERGYRVLFLQRGIVAEFNENLQRLYFEKPLVSYAALASMFKSK
ncbi:cysteine hydrolase [Acholeplasma equirhinis]|uniref:cysteine hydrolase family protein n=1 Tax=Acholeplasma equirhinis TaxID=555393 RepID=UPI00197B0717|nr:isochorismatase family protein [Acholeplasma equirhinis]MBN3491134.1 cysteine hydrolase [Acholeplasma equirhinis]